MLTAWNLGQSSLAVATYVGLMGGYRPRAEATRFDAAVIAFWAAGSVSNMVN